MNRLIAIWTRRNGRIARQWVAIEREFDAGLSDATRKALGI